METGIFLAAYAIRYRLILSPDPFTYWAYFIQVGGVGVSVLITQIIWLLGHWKLVEIFSRMTSIDRKLLQLRIKTTYDTVFYFSCAFATVFPLPWSAIMSSNRTLKKKICDMIGYCYPIVVRFIVTFLATTIIMVFLDRYKKLNQFLEELDAVNSSGREGKGCGRKLYGRRTNIYVLWKVQEIHNDLTACCKLFSETFSHIILINISYNYLQFVFSIYFLYAGASDELSLREISIALSAFSIQMAVLFYYIYELEEEAKNTFVTLGHVNFFKDHHTVSLKVFP